MFRRTAAILCSLSIALTAALALAAPVAAARPTECVGALTGAVTGNVFVPRGAHCEMDAAVVTGNVLVRKGASLRASFSEISGNVIGQNSSWVCLQFGSQLGGNFSVKGGDLGTTTGFDVTVTVGGHARVTGNAGLTFIDAANVAGNIIVKRNTGNLEIEHNTVGGNVSIVNNVVPTTYSGGPALPLPGACGVPTSFQLLTGGMSIFNNNLGSTGNMHVIRNTGPGNKQVTSNTVKNLVCRRNTAPFLGGPNVAQHAVGQCF